MAPINDVSRPWFCFQIYNKKREGLKSASEGGVVVRARHISFRKVIVAVGDVRGFVVGQRIPSDGRKYLYGKYEDKPAKHQKTGQKTRGFHDLSLKGSAGFEK